MRETVVLEVERNSPIARVWQALTDAATLAKWMLFETTDFRPVVGHKFQFRMESNPEWTIVVDCEVLEVDAPRRLSSSWVVASQSHHTTVTWTLTEAPTGGTRLHLEQSGFDSRAKQEIGGARHGWKQMLDQLQRLLASQ